MEEPLDHHLRCAKESINLHDFELAKHHLLKAFDLDPKSPQVINLAGVMLEMREEFAMGGRCHGAIFKTEFLVTKTGWLFKLFHFGALMKH